MVYGYIRVSTDKQTVENQRFEIEQFCRREGLRIDRWIEETISGTVAWKKRRLGHLIHRAHADDLLLCAELSRLGRSLFMVLEVLNLCLARKIRVWSIKDNFRLGDDIPSKVLAFAFALSAEIERTLISQRTKEALARRKAAGLHLGRPHGLRPAPKLARHDRALRQMLALGYSKNHIARHFHVNVQTLRRYLRQRALA